MPIGQLAHLGVGKEVTWGTAVASADYIPIISESLTEDIEQIADESLKATRFENKSLQGLTEVKGDIVAEVRPSSIGSLLRSALGSVSTTGTNPYTHTFTPSVAAFDAACFLPSYTFEVHRDFSQAFQYAGCVVNTLQFDYGTKQKILRATAGIIGKSAALITKTTPNFETSDPFLWHQATVTLGGSAFNLLEDFSLKLDNKMAGVPLVNNTKLIGAILPDGRATADLDLTMHVTDLTQYNNFKNATDQQMIVEFIAGTNKIKFTLPLVRFLDYPVNVRGPGRISVKVKAKVWVDNTFEVKLTNSRTSY